MLDAIQFGFIVLLPLIVVGAVLAGLFATGALFEALDHPEQLKTRIEGAFRRPPRAPQKPAPDHYYKPYWDKLPGA